MIISLDLPNQDVTQTKRVLSNTRINPNNLTLEQFCHEAVKEAMRQLDEEYFDLTGRDPEALEIVVNFSSEESFSITPRAGSTLSVHE